MKEELPVLGIVAHDMEAHIDGEIRRELRNVFAIMPCKAVSVIACHEVSTQMHGESASFVATFVRFE